MTLPQDVGSGGGGIFTRTNSKGSTIYGNMSKGARQNGPQSIYNNGVYTLAGTQGSSGSERAFLRRKSILLSLLYAVSLCAVALASRGTRGPRTWEEGHHGGE